MQLVETSDAAGCMFDPSMAAMHEIYWFSLTRRRSLLWSDLVWQLAMFLL